MKKVLALLIVLLLVPLTTSAQDPCEGNFDCDQDVDGTDAFIFKTDFGRSQLSNPCPATSDCCYGTLSPLGRWCDQNDGTVKDMSTGLVWLKDAGWGGLKLWEDCTTHDDAHTRAGALYAGMPGAGLSDGSVEGDWRLPTKSELVGITLGDEYIRYNQMHSFTNLQYGYWSSTTLAVSPNFAWAVGMEEGEVAYIYKNDLVNYVWPVRGGH